VIDYAQYGIAWASGKSGRWMSLMEISPPILPYPSQTDAPAELQVRERNGAFRVHFPLPPIWVEILAITVCGLTGIGNLAMAVVLPVQLGRLIGWRSIPGNLRHVLIVGSVIRLLASGLWFVAAGMPLYRLKRWGRVPQRITATSSGLVVSKMGWVRPRHRFWAADQLTEVRLQPPAKSLIPGKTVATLLIRRRGWKLPLSFRLSSRDSQLPTHIAERLAATLGCPLKIRS
jgi:hypothetical protein